jgi:hypothetical protein
VMAATGASVRGACRRMLVADVRLGFSNGTRSAVS